MHELSITKNMLDIVIKDAKRKALSHIVFISVELGSLAGIEKSGIEFYYPFVSRSTIAQNAKLHILECSGVAWCENCHDQVTIGKRFLPCPTCGEFLLKIIEGEQFRVKSYQGY